MSTNKKPICYNSDKCRAMKSVEPWIWKIVRIFPQILHYLHCKRRWSQLFLCFRASNPRKHFDFRSRLLCFHTANQKNWIKFENPMSPEPFDSRAKAPPAKRWEKGYGDENAQNTAFCHSKQCCFLVPSLCGLGMERLGPWPPFWQQRMVCILLTYGSLSTKTLLVISMNYFLSFANCG